MLELSAAHVLVGSLFFYAENMLKGFCLQQKGDKALHKVLYCKTNLLHGMTALKGLTLYSLSVVLDVAT